MSNDWILAGERQGYRQRVDVGSCFWPAKSISPQLSDGVRMKVSNEAAMTIATSPLRPQLNAVGEASPGVP